MSVHEKAYEIWLKRGCPVGEDGEIWFEAQKENFLSARRLTKTITGDLYVEIVHKADISDLVRINPEFVKLSKLDFCESDALCWDMEGKAAYCMQVMFIGKTGYGKSTTLNKISGGKYFLTDDIESCTKKLYSSEYKLSSYAEHYFSLCDLPGIGESVEADKEYIRWYGNMLEKSNCVVYVLRSDQRDYSHDEIFINTILKNNGKISDKLIVGINYADKIEPISRTTPFVPSDEQKNNLERKAESIAKLFGIHREKIVYYSAKEGYNMHLLLNKIAITII